MGLMKGKSVFELKVCLEKKYYEKRESMYV